MEVLTRMAISANMGKGPKHMNTAAVVVRGVLCEPHALGVAASLSWSWFSLVGRLIATHWVSTSCCRDWQLVIASCGVKAYVSTLNALLLFTHPHENPLHPTPHFQAGHPEFSPIFIQQIFICADRGPGIVLSTDKETIIKKRGPTPDIMELQFREGVREVNQVTAYLLN